MENIIHIKEELFMGSGTQRKCYMHPSNPDLCIKFLLDPKNKSDMRQMTREIKYLKKLNSYNRGQGLEFLTRYCGDVKSDLGKGYVFEIVKDYDGNISKSLVHYLRNENLLMDNYDKIVSALKTLKKRIYDEGVVLKNIFPCNLLLQKTSDGKERFVIIDDIGTPTVIPLEYYFKPLARNKLNRYWKRYLVPFIKENYANQTAQKLALVIETI